MKQHHVLDGCSRRAACVFKIHPAAVGRAIRLRMLSECKAHRRSQLCGSSRLPFSNRTRRLSPISSSANTSLIHSCKAQRATGLLVCRQEKNVERPPLVRLEWLIVAWSPCPGTASPRELCNTSCTQDSSLPHHANFAAANLSPTVEGFPFAACVPICLTDQATEPLRLSTTVAGNQFLLLRTPSEHRPPRSCCLQSPNNCILDDSRMGRKYVHGSRWRPQRTQSG